jgi:hypothetical protein
MPTNKQKKLIKLIRENLGNPNNTKTYGELCLEAGYTKATSKNAYLIFQSDAVKEGTEDFINSLDDKRKMAITHITESKLEKAPAREVAYTIDILTKNHQLLTGGKTENTGIGELADQLNSWINSKK